MKFNVRLREITFYDFDVEAESYKEAFSNVMGNTANSIPDRSCGKRYEIESITLGRENESSKDIQNPDNKQIEPICIGCSRETTPDIRDKITSQ